jgi:hypothetical protein
VNTLILTHKNALFFTFEERRNINIMAGLTISAFVVPVALEGIKAATQAGLLHSLYIRTNWIIHNCGDERRTFLEFTIIFFITTYK